MQSQRREPLYGEQFLHDLFGPDFILPEQFYARRGQSSTLTGERALMWAVLTDGIESFRRTARGHTASEVEEFKEAREWLLTDNWDWIFSFGNLCEQFGLDPRSVREALLHWADAGADTGRRQRFRPVSLRAA